VLLEEELELLELLLLEEELELLEELLLEEELELLEELLLEEELELLEELLLEEELELLEVEPRTLQLLTLRFPLEVPWKPTEVEPPAFRLPFQLMLLAVTVLPEDE